MGTDLCEIPELSGDEHLRASKHSLILGNGTPVQAIRTRFSNEELMTRLLQENDIVQAVDTTATPEYRESSNEGTPCLSLIA